MRKRWLLLAVVVIVIVAAVAVLIVWNRNGGGTDVAASVATGAASTRLAAHAGPSDIYPDPTLTPGDVFPDVTAAQICTPGYARRVRDVPVEEKREVYQRYNIPYTPGKYEVDHFIPLELGGSNAVTNLWPERYSPPPGAHEKDKVENYLHNQVCSGAMTLQQAQDAIRTDWYAIYQQIAGH